MSFFGRLFARRDPKEKIEHLAHLKLKLQEVISGRYMLKPADCASNLFELEENIRAEIARLERSRD